MKWIAALFVCAAAASATDAPDTFEPWRYIHPRAGFIAGFDWRKTAGSEFARVLKDQFSGGTGRLRSNTDFIEAFDSLVVSGPVPKSGQMKPGEGLLVLRGRFNLPKLRKDALQKGGRTQRYDGIELLTVDGMTAAVIDERTLVSGDRASVTEALRLRERLSTDTPLIERARELAGSASAWVIASGLASNPKMPGVTGISAAVTLRRNAEIDVRLESPEPEKIAPMLAAMTAMMSMQPGTPGLKVANEPGGIRISGAFTPEQLRGTFRNVGEQMLSRMAGAAPQAEASVQPPQVEEPPLPPEKQVVRIYGLEEGVKEIPLKK